MWAPALVAAMGGEAAGDGDIEFACADGSWAASLSSTAVNLRVNFWKRIIPWTLKNSLALFRSSSLARFYLCFQVIE